MDKRKTAGVFYALSSYLIWGFTPIYWKIFSGTGSLELLAHRIFWACFVSFLIFAATKSLGDFGALLKDRRRMGWVVLRAVLLSVNWFTYVWAVSNGMVLEASLGYYLNPLISILLGLFFLKESLTRLQWIAVGFAAVGVGLKTVLVGSFPLVSVILAISFGFYGLLKKKSTEGSLLGIGAESLILLPVAAIFLIFNEVGGSGSFVSAGIGMKLVFVTTGIVTVIPLFLFSKGTSRIPLVWIGFLQFIAPTMMLAFGIFLYGEVMSVYDFIGFASVWIGIIIFLVSSRRS